eukprot:CAMPEP_0170184898 /NCGR_PEP_ID=MMETSP0040_2-20121228/35017_1 /TAXON_ID=641309 /ORGANISM="Lotharella oceanica, Strain CCMP622" /LENGTH=126 /DNA_ID=CAMNT_0010431113 /DNA_START=198 /DNA_END=578 /DNA_ORIENTATION=-
MVVGVAGASAAVEKLVRVVGRDRAAVCGPCREASLDHRYVCEAELVEDFAGLFGVVTLCAHNNNSVGRIAGNPTLFNLLSEDATGYILRAFDVRGKKFRTVTDVNHDSLLAIFEQLSKAHGGEHFG